MLTLGELSNRIDALKQLRRFNPDVPVYVDGRRAVTAVESISFENDSDRESVAFSIRSCAEAAA